MRTPPAGLDVGLGQGRLPEEFTATGAPLNHRGDGFEEHIAVMRACWEPDPVAHAGKLHTVPVSTIGPKPYRGTLPLLIGGVARGAVERAARPGAGFVCGVLNWYMARTSSTGTGTPAGRVP